MVILVSLLISLIFFAFKYYKKGYNFTTFLFFIYSISVACSIAYELIYEKSPNILNLFSIIYLFIILIIWFIPFNNLSVANINSICYNKHQIRKLSTYLILFLIPATLFFGYYGLKTIINSDLSTIRTEEDRMSTFPISFVSSLMIYLSSYYNIALFLFFISLKDKWGSKYNFGLFISSFSFVMLTLCFAGRDGIIFWFLNYILFYIIFKNSFPEKKKRIWKIISILFICFFIVIFLIITLYRFSYPYNALDYSIKSILSYAGQQTRNFSDAFNINLPFYNTLTPAFNRLIGVHEDIDYINLLVEQNAYSEYNVFGFFVKSFLWGYGKIGTIIISILFFILIRKIKRNYLKNKNIYDLLILIFLFQIPMNGVFYYRQSVGGMDFSYLVGIIFLLILKSIQQYSNRKT